MTMHCGFIALIGRPNVGKSTLMNHLLGQKISITSRKPQTTRHRIVGVLTEGEDQMCFVDTPGLHQNAPMAMNRYMNTTSLQVLKEVDVIVWMIDATRWTDDDAWIFQKINKLSVPVIAVINKMDKLPNKGEILPFIQQLDGEFKFAAIIPVSAKEDDNLAALVEQIKKLLPERDFFYPEEQVTDKSVRFLCAEIIREKIMRATGAEVPYAMTIEIEEYKEIKKVVHISAIIWVEKANQKAIVIGEGGERLKAVGTAARLDIERMIEQKVFLRLWCKVKEGWSDDERALQSLGYTS